MASASEACGRHSVKGCHTQMVSLVFSGVVRVIYVFGLRRRSRPVMSAGGESPRMPSMGGARSGGGPPGAGWGVHHGFGVPVGGGDDPSAPTRLEPLIKAAEARVHGFDGFDGGFEFAG